MKSYDSESDNDLVLQIAELLDENARLKDNCEAGIQPYDLETLQDDEVDEEEELESIQSIVDEEDKLLIEHQNTLSDVIRKLENFMQ